MNADLDPLLSRMSAGVDDVHLDGLEDAVFARIHQGRQNPGMGLRIVGIAGAGAIALGTVAAGPAPVAASAPLSPFGASSPLAPSTLLMSDK